MTEASPRTRTITWEDPAAVGSRAVAMSGLEAMQAMQTGKLPPPPVAMLIDIQPTDVSPGRVVFELEPAEYQYNPLGSVHGGILATLMDTSMSCAVHTMLSAGSGYSTVDLSAKFVRPVRVDTGILRSEGSVVHFGSRTATAQCQVTDSAGKVYAHGAVTCLLLHLGGTQ